MKNKTVVYEGNVYEIGKDYLFGESLTLGKLEAIRDGLLYSFKGQDTTGLHVCAQKIRLVSVDAGTITPVRISLINGNAYTFKYHADMEPVVGIYDDVAGRLMTNQSIYPTNLCTNIRAMEVKETK